MLDLTRVQTAVTNGKTVQESAITLLGSLSQALRDAAGDPAAVTAIADEMDANAAALAEAVAANTPAAGASPSGRRG